MPAYDIYLRHASVGGGEWLGYPLAWKGLAGLPGLPARPYRRWFDWVLDPTRPNDPALGSRGALQWRLDLALVDNLVGLDGAPPADGRTANDMRLELEQFMAAGVIDLQDADDRPYAVVVTHYAEDGIEPFDAVHPNGGMIATVELARPL